MKKHSTYRGYDIFIHPYYPHMLYSKHVMQLASLDTIDILHREIDEQIADKGEDGKKYIVWNFSDFVEDKLKEEMEGNLYAEISLKYTGGDYVVRRDIYAVIGGKVAGVSEEKEPYFTDKSLLDLKTQCHHIGKYEPNNKIFFKAKLFTYQELNDILDISSF